MSEPLVLVILLGASPDPTTDGMMAAARRALGPDAIVLADSSPVTSDVEALAIGERVHARAVARVSWADGSQTTARLHVHVAPSSEWADDELTFLPQDVTSEKGRTVGYALATMVQRIERERTEEKERSPEPANEPGPIVLGPPAIAPPSAGEPSGLSSAARETRAEATPSPAPRGIDFLVFGTGALGSGATSAGGGGGVRVWPLSRVGLRAAVGARAGSIPEANASTTTLFAAAGPGFRVPIGRALELGARADFLLLQHSVTRQHPNTTTHARWLSAIDVVIEASVALGPHAGVFAGVGAELAFGTTAVSVGGVPAADIPPARGIAEAGARFRF